MTLATGSRRIANMHPQFLLYGLFLFGVFEIISAVSIHQPDVKTVLEAGKLEQKRQRVNEQIKRRQEKENAEAEERERLKQYKPIVLEVTPSTTHPNVGQVGSQKNTGKPVVEKQKRIARQAVHQHVRPHRPQDIYKKIWNMRDKTAL